MFALQAAGHRSQVASSCDMRYATNGTAEMLDAKPCLRPGVAAGIAGGHSLFRWARLRVDGRIESRRAHGANRCGRNANRCGRIRRSAPTRRRRCRRGGRGDRCGRCRQRRHVGRGGCGYPPTMDTTDSNVTAPRARGGTQRVPGFRDCRPNLVLRGEHGWWVASVPAWLSGWRLPPNQRAT